MLIQKANLVTKKCSWINADCKVMFEHLGYVEQCGFWVDSQEQQNLIINLGQFTKNNSLEFSGMYVVPHLSSTNNWFLKCIFSSSLNLALSFTVLRKWKKVEFNRHFKTWKGESTEYRLVKIIIKVVCVFFGVRSQQRILRGSVHFDRFALFQFIFSWWETFCHFEIFR